jgi:hypothetical protein
VIDNDFASFVGRPNVAGVEAEAVSFGTEAELVNIVTDAELNLFNIEI